MDRDEWLEMFAENLAALMRETGISQLKLSRRSCLAQSTISRYLAGERMPDARAVLNISYALGCDVADLIDFGDIIE